MVGKELQREVARLVAEYGGPNNDGDLTIATLGLCGEAGEVANDVKKFMYGKYTFQELRERSEKELKDCLWFLVALANGLNLDMDELLAGTPAHMEAKLIAAQSWIRKAGTDVEVFGYQ